LAFGKYFNKRVKALDTPHLGYVVRETEDKIIVFGEGNDRYDIPKSVIRTTRRNVLIGLNLYEIANKYKVSREEILPRSNKENNHAVTKKTIANMIMGNNYSKNTTPLISSGTEIVDTETLVYQTQDRMWKALKGNYRYDSSLKDSQDFLFNYVNSKVSLVIMYADLVGSTNMTMNLAIDKMVTIVRAFTHEMTSSVRSYGGYVLKYVGDAIIAFFPSGYNKLLACDKSVQCAKSMITVIRNGINPILNRYDYPELSVKIGIDEGENVIVQYGHDKSSLIDILGYSMSITAKITSLTDPNKITVGEDVYNVLHPEIKSNFVEVKSDAKNWKYTDRETGRLYKLYTLQG
jgi:adenylate cyclase